MAEQVQGALNARQGDASTQEATPSFASQVLQDSMIARQKENADASERTKKLLESLDSRRNMPFNPMLMKLAAGMLRPTKTGSFGESVGYAAEGMSEQAEKEFKQRQEDAKLRFELESKMAEQRRQAAGMEVTNKLFSGRPVSNSLGTSSNAPSAVDSPFPAEGEAVNPAKILSVDHPNINITGNSKKIPLGSSPSIELSTRLAENQQQKMPALTLDEKNIYRQVDPEGFKFLEEQEENQRKIDKNRRDILIPFEVDGVKTFLSPQENDRLEKAIEARDEKTVKNILLKKGLSFNYIIDKSGEWSPKSAAQSAADIERAKAESSLEMKDYRIPEIGNDFYPMLPKDYADYRRSKLESPEALEKWLSTYRSKAEDRVVGSEERKAISAGRTTEQQELAKTRAETRKGYFDNARLAETLSRPAKNIYMLASDPIRSKALGLLEDPTVGDAFLGVIAQGAAVGSFNVGIPAIREAVAKLKGTTDEEKSKIMDSFQALARNYSELELNFTRMYLKGEGAVTEGERKIVRDVSGGLANRRNVALAQAETLMQRTEFDKTVKSELMAWEKKNPGKSIEDFQESKQYTSLKNSLENNMDKIYNKYFSDSKPKTESKTELKTEPDGKPMSIIDRLKAEKAARKLAAEKAPKGTQ